MRAHTVIGSALGCLTLVAEFDAIVGLHMDQQRHRPDDRELGEPDPRGRGAEPFKAAARQLDAYFAGELTTFDLPLVPHGSPFQQRVWAALQDIPYGRTESYGELAERIGSPGGARAVGLANGIVTRAIVSSVPMAASPATAEGWTVRGRCSTSSWR
jgi:methylated-DNA-[protein]-cysteine S-methyltransferase